MKAARFLATLTFLGLAACASHNQPEQPPPDEAHVTVLGQPGAVTTEELSSAANAITETLGSRPQFSAVEAPSGADVVRLYWNGQPPAEILADVLQSHPNVAVEVVGTTHAPDALRAVADKLVRTEPGVGAAAPRADGSGIRIEVFPEEISGTPEQLADRLAQETGFPIDVGTAPPVPAN